MGLDEAKKVLGKAINERGELDCLNPVLFWKPGQIHVVMDGKFSVRALEAIVVYVRSFD